jgi:hypothetical protein
LFLDAVGRHMQPEGVVQDAFAHRRDGFRDIVALEQLVALRVDDLALIVGDVVVFEQLLADVEVARLDLALRRFQRTRDERMLDRLALGHLQALHDRLQAITGKNAQQRIIEGEVEARRPGIALATGTAAQLVVDAPRLVTFRADDVQAARRQRPGRAAFATERGSRRCAHRVQRQLLLRRHGSARSASRHCRQGRCRYPRPAMLVAMVIIPGRPASRTISASRACCLALST